MSKIKEAFEKKKVFVGFLTAGDPNLAKTEEFILKMQEAGAGLIEIGIPFSDPIAEGPVIQEANVRALSNEGGCTLDMVFDMVERIRPQVTDTPVAIGFGIHSPEQAEKMGQLADGVIVGSAIVKLIAKYGTEAGEPVAEYVRSMSKALK